MSGIRTGRQFIVSFFIAIFILIYIGIFFAFSIKESSDQINNPKNEQITRKLE